MQVRFKKKKTKNLKEHFLPAHPIIFVKTLTQDVLENTKPILETSVSACAHNREQHRKKSTSINVLPQKWSVSLTLNIYKSKKCEITIHLEFSPPGYPKACQLVLVVLTTIHSVYRETALRFRSFINSSKSIRADPSSIVGNRNASF